MSSLYEIVELENGEIALQRVDEGGEPLVCIRFSEESLYFLNDARFVIAKAMIEAGLDAASDIQEQHEQPDFSDETDMEHSSTLH
ncbi:hypothetical protein [Teredinibacter turnerae]|uniref:hypothetical protein n=1 Tax=Teredinibacter turnerae TaxID=2426 RepID=UPI00038242FF|nr:hypothetical protein [Teredinibacter turnerae]